MKIIVIYLLLYLINNQLKYQIRNETDTLNFLEYCGQLVFLATFKTKFEILWGFCVGMFLQFIQEHSKMALELITFRFLGLDFSFVHVFLVIESSEDNTQQTEVTDDTQLK